MLRGRRERTRSQALKALVQYLPPSAIRLLSSLPRGQCLGPEAASLGRGQRSGVTVSDGCVLGPERYGLGDRLGGIVPAKGRERDS